MAWQSHCQPQSQDSLWLPLKYKKQDKRPLWEGTLQGLRQLHGQVGPRPHNKNPSAAGERAGKAAAAPSGGLGGSSRETWFLTHRLKPSP